MSPLKKLFSVLLLGLADFWLLLAFLLLHQITQVGLSFIAVFVLSFVDSYVCLL